MILADNLIPNPGTINTTGNGARLTQQLVPGSNSGLTDILANFWNHGLNLFLLFITLCAMWVIVGAAITYARSRGDAKTTALARATLVQAILGVALLVASTVVVSLIIALIHFATGSGS